MSNTAIGDLNSTVYRGVQRVFRNAVVGYLRQRLQIAFPTDYAEKIKKPFKHEWAEIEEAARSSTEVGALEIRRTDEFDLLGVNHFFNLFDAYWSALEPTADSAEKPNPKLRQSIVGWLREIKNLRDPISHPGDEDLSRENAFHVLDCARRVLVSLRLDAAAKEVHEAQQEVIGNDQSVETEPLEAKLPSQEAIVTDFVGRDGELARLWDWVTDPIAQRWALAGEGGKGKSAIAYTFARRVVESAPPPLTTVIWLTAKKQQFVEGKTVPLTQRDFEDLGTALDCVLTHFGWTEELNAPLETRRNRVLDLLKAFPALLIVDDVDSLEAEHEDAIEFFTLHVPASTRSKVLLTSRRTVFGMGASTTHISGFNHHDGEAFIRSRCQLMELDSKLFDKSTSKELLKVSEGSPLYVEDILRLSAAVKSVPEALKAWSGRRGVEARKYALGRECELLEPSARQVLFAACVTTGPVSFIELEAITGLSSEMITTAIQQLQRLFLVPKPTLVEGEQRFAINVNTKALVKETYGDSTVFKELESAYRAVSGGAPLASRARVSALVRQASFLLRAKRSEEAERLLKSGLDVYPNDPDLTGALGWLYKAWEPVRLTDARERFRRAAQLKNTNEETYEHWAKMEWRASEWTRAAEAAECGLKLLPSSKILLYWAGRARCRAARDLAGGLHHEKSQAEAQVGRELLERALATSDSSARLGDGHVYRSLVLACELLVDHVAMRKYFRRWHRLSPEDPDFVSEWDRLSKKFKLANLHDPQPTPE